MDSRKLGIKGTLLSIALYLIVMSIFENIYADSESQGFRIIPSGVILFILLWGMVKGNMLSEYGLGKQMALSWRKTLYMFPMFVLATANLWHGAILKYEPIETFLYMLSMICIGTIEEILFRGYLLQLLLKRSVKKAIWVSSLTFGIGHVINILNGAPFTDTLMQIIYAVAIGFMLSVFVIKTKNLIPCCVFHGVFNALAAFANDQNITSTYQLAVCVIITAIALGYAWYLWSCNMR